MKVNPLIVCVFLALIALFMISSSGYAPCTCKEPNRLGVYMPPMDAFPVSDKPTNEYPYFYKGV